MRLSPTQLTYSVRTLQRTQIRQTGGKCVRCNGLSPSLLRLSLNSLAYAESLTGYISRAKHSLASISCTYFTKLMEKHGMQEPWLNAFIEVALGLGRIGLVLYPFTTKSQDAVQSTYKDQSKWRH